MWHVRITTYYYRGVNIFYLLADHHDAAIFRLKKKIEKNTETRREGTQQEIAGNIAPPAVCMPICAPPAGVYVSAGTRQKDRVYDSSVSVSDKKILHDVISAACAPAPEARYIKMT